MQHMQQRLRRVIAVVGVGFVQVLSRNLGGEIVSPLIAQSSPTAQTRPSADSVPMTAEQIAQFKALNDRYRPQFQALVTEVRKTPGDTGVLRRARELQAEYTTQYQAILTPSQRTQLRNAEAAARARAATLPKPQIRIRAKVLAGGTTR